MIDQVLLGILFIDEYNKSTPLSYYVGENSGYVSRRSRDLSRSDKNDLLPPVQVCELVRKDGTRHYAITVGGRHNLDGGHVSLGFDDSISSGDLSSIHSSVSQSTGFTQLGTVNARSFDRSPEQAQVDLYNALKILKIRRDRMRKDVAGRKAAEHLIVG